MKEIKGRGTKRGNKKMKNKKRMQKRGKKKPKKKVTRSKKKKSGTKKRKSKLGKTEVFRTSNRNINYTECVMQMKEFASRIKKAGNLERQAKRIKNFQKINDDKKGKVKLGRHFHSCGISVLVERKF